jgi:hypothetical protein
MKSGGNSRGTVGVLGAKRSDESNPVVGWNDDVDRRDGRRNLDPNLPTDFSVEINRLAILGDPRHGGIVVLNKTL